MTDMTDKTQPDAGSTHIIRYALELGLLWIDGDGRDKVREALDALDALEAQLEAIGAGDVSKNGAGLNMSTQPPASPTPPAEQQAQPGAVYAELPEPTTHQIAEIKACEHGDAIVGWRVEPSRQSFHASMHPKRTLYTTEQARNFADRTHALRMQAAPKAAPGESDYSKKWDAELGRTAMRFVDRAGDVHPGIDDAETICAEFHKAMSEVIERMPHVQRMAAPQQEAQEPGEIPESIERMATGRYKVVPSHESMFHRWAVVAGSGTQQLYLGREVECQNMARKFAGAFLDGAFVAMQSTAPQPAPAPLSRDQIREVFMAHGFTIKEGQTDLKQYVYDAAYALLGTKPAPLSDDVVKDAARYQWLREGNDAKHGAAWHVAVNLYGCEWDAAIDAAIAAQGGKA